VRIMPERVDDLIGDAAGERVVVGIEARERQYFNRRLDGLPPSDGLPLTGGEPPQHDQDDKRKAKGGREPRAWGAKGLLREDTCDDLCRQLALRVQFDWTRESRR